MQYRDILKTMYRSRFFEEKIQTEFQKGTFHGTTHLAIGQEASHVGLSIALQDGDWIVPTHRCHGFNVARGSSLEAMFSEMLGSRHGLCKGLGGSMHMTDIGNWNLGSSAVVGSGVPLAGGCAFALKRQNKANIAVAILGDGATSRGSVHEMMNLASVWKLPLLFFLENNHYGMSASSDRMISISRISDRAEGYSMAHGTVDGNDVLAVAKAVEEARDYILSSSSPYFLEVETYRQCGHSKSDKRLYRTREEEEAWLEKDPIALFLRKGLVPADDVAKTEVEARREVEEAWEVAYGKKDDVLILSEAEALVMPEALPFRTEENATHKATYRGAVREALDEILSSSPRYTLIGEDIGVYGGCFGVTGDLWKKHPGQMWETPVSEEAFTGMATGAAMLGERPICEIMYGDFATLASDAIINHGSKAHFMSGGQLSSPMVVRMAIGGGTGHGPQHTQCLETMFQNIPGLKVVAPSSAYDAKALLKSAAKENCPVVFLEHKALYGCEGEVGGKETFLPLGKAKAHGNGGDLLVIGYSRALVEAEKALGEKATYLDLCTLKPLDEESIRAYGSRFSSILVVQDTPLLGSVAESVLRLLPEGKAVRVVSALDSPVAFTKSLESQILPSAERIRKETEALLERD